MLWDDTTYHKAFQEDPDVLVASEKNEVVVVSISRLLLTYLVIKVAPYHHTL